MKHHGISMLKLTGKTSYIQQIVCCSWYRAHHLGLKRERGWMHLRLEKICWRHPRLQENKGPPEQSRSCQLRPREVDLEASGRVETSRRRGETRRCTERRPEEPRPRRRCTSPWQPVEERSGGWQTGGAPAPELEGAGKGPEARILSSGGRWPRWTRRPEHPELAADSDT
jgi:hypothetical protein